MTLVEGLLAAIVFELAIVIIYAATIMLDINRFHERWCQWLNACWRDWETVNNPKQKAAHAQWEKWADRGLKSFQKEVDD